MDNAWWKAAIFYQIYPRSFKDSNGDGIGDLPGIIEKLDYLVELGITALWVSPFFKSPMDDFGYDISDYCDVDALFGTLADAKRLIAEAHQRKIKIVFDLVINHTSDQHPWFAEARSSRSNPKHDWYIWKPRTDSVTGKPLPVPNNWICQFEFKSAWWPNEATDEWYLGTFTHHQPEVNWRNPELKNAMYDVVRFWLDLGIDGFRMDVVNWFIKDGQFRSNPFSFRANPDLFQKHIHDRNQRETHGICREIRQIADGYPGERVLIGEIFTREAAVAASYQGNGTDELHLSFNMEMLYLKWNARSFVQALRRCYAVQPERGWPNITLSNHDQMRHASRLGLKNEKTQLARMQIASMLLLTVRGTPFMYYGEEIGMTNTPIPKKELVDPTGITFWPLPVGRDGERTPMQWTDEITAGFTSPGTTPWLRVNPNRALVNVERQQKNPLSLWNWYRAMISLRKKYPALTAGAIAFLSDGNNSVIAYRRSIHQERPPTTGEIDCYLNFAGSERSIILPAKARVLLGNQRIEKEYLEEGPLVLAPHEALLVTF